MQLTSPNQSKRTVQKTKRLVKNTMEKLIRNLCHSAAKMAAAAGISQTSMHQILNSEPILTKCIKYMNFQPHMNI